MLKKTKPKVKKHKTPDHARKSARTQLEAALAHDGFLVVVGYVEGGKLHTHYSSANFPLSDVAPALREASIMVHQNELSK